MPNTSTSTPCMVFFGAKMLLRTRITRVVNSEEDRSVCRMGQPERSAISTKAGVGSMAWVKMQQGISQENSWFSDSLSPSRSSFFR